MTMLPILIAGLAALAVIVLALGISMSGGPNAVASRLERYAGEGAKESDGAGDRQESAVVAGLGRAMERQGMSARLKTDLARADLKLKPAEFVMMWLASPIAFVVAGVLLGAIFTGLRNPAILAVIGLFGAWFPRIYLKRRQAKRLRTFAEQLPGTITLLANSLRAGSSFLQGMELITREARPPISEEFERVVREMQLGVALQPALNNLVRRVASEDLELMVTAIQIQSQVGGNLATVLDAIAHTIRERVRIQGEIATLTAMQKYSGYVITGLPIALGGILFAISPSYMGPMLERPPELLGLPLGLVFFLVGGLSMAGGYVFISRIVNIKV